MDIRVTRTKVIVDNGYIVNQGEYKVNPCEFEFSEEYTSDLVKKAVFVTKNVEVERVILDNKCDIPYDVLSAEMFELHVYAYAVVDDELVLRYSPTYAKIFLREGSYRGVTGSGEVITPTQFEQYESALNEGLQELEEGLQEVANVDIDASKSGSIATITITNRNGVEKSVQVEDGTDYVLTPQDKQDIANIAEQDLTPLIPTKVSQLDNDSEFINKEVNNLTNYYKTTETYTKDEVDSKLSAVYKFKGSVNTYADLPTTGLTIGDVYNVIEDGSNYAWTGSIWDKLGGDIDLSGYQTKIDSTHKLSSDLVDDTNNTNKFVTASDKTIWNNKYAKPSGGIPKTDLDSSVQTSLGKADTAIQDLSNYYNKSEVYNKTEIDSMVGDINSALDIINGEVI